LPPRELLFWRLFYPADCVIQQIAERCRSPRLVLCCRVLLARFAFHCGLLAAPKNRPGIYLFSVYHIQCIRPARSWQSMYLLPIAAARERTSIISRAALPKMAMQASDARQSSDALCIRTSAKMDYSVRMAPSNASRHAARQQ